MGPLTHAPEVNAAIVRHITDAQTALRQAGLSATSASLDRFDSRRDEEAMA
jgi:hypothetical protein